MDECCEDHAKCCKLSDREGPRCGSALGRDVLNVPDYLPTASRSTGQKARVDPHPAVGAVRLVHSVLDLAPAITQHRSQEGGVIRLAEVGPWPEVVKPVERRRGPSQHCLKVTIAVEKLRPTVLLHVA